MGSQTVTWRSPSNIAIVKYWGKKDQQIPRNPSLSFTLSNAFTETTINYGPGSGQVQFHFAGQENPAFAQRIRSYLKQISTYLPHLSQWDLDILSDNSFPHSAGIASSASAMSALVLGLVDMEQEVLGASFDEDAFRNRVSFLSRLASGSACRSVFPQGALWGSTPEVAGSSDLFAVGIPALHEDFLRYQDSIIIIHAGAKAVSSSAGHELMNGHPFAASRYDQARQNLKDLLHALKEGDVNLFGQLAEYEALTLHGLMLCSKPGFTLLKPETLAWIDALRNYRDESGIPVFFTLDAGPNLHILYPYAHQQTVHAWITDQAEHLSPLRVLHDEMGSGPVKLGS